MRTMDACDRAWDRKVDPLLDAEPGGVDHQDGARTIGIRAFERVGVRVCEGVTRRAELESDEVVESVPAIGRGRESQPVPGRDGAHR